MVNAFCRSVAAFEAEALLEMANSVIESGRLLMVRFSIACCMVLGLMSEPVT